jgi:hypothetical protein
MAERYDRLDITHYAFEPAGGAAITASTASSRVALSGGGPQIIVTNLSADNGRLHRHR